jgi:hypothetical protein
MLRRLSTAGNRSALQASSSSSGARGPDDEGGQQPALGRAVAGQARLAGRQVLDVLRQLAVQELAGVFALGADHAPIGKAAGA